MAEDIIAMIQTLDRDSLRGLGDRSMLLIGFAGGLRLSEIVCLDQVGPDRRRPRLDRNPRQGHAHDASWQNRMARGRDGRGSSDATYQVAAMEA